MSSSARTTSPLRTPDRSADLKGLQDHAKNLTTHLSNYVHSTERDGASTKGKLLGAAFVVVDKDGPIYSNALGRTSIEATATTGSWRPDTLLWIASLTKLISATGIMKLVKEGILSLEEDLRPLLPELAQQKILDDFEYDGTRYGNAVLFDHDNPITLRHLLTHTAGLGYDIVDPLLSRWAASVGRTATNLDWTVEGYTTPLLFEPGDGWSYGSAIDWAGLAAERKLGESFGAYLQREFFDELDMMRTTFHPEELASRGIIGPEQRTDLPGGWVCRRPDGELVTSDKSKVPAEHPIESYGAGLFSTAADFGKFMAALLDDDNTLVPRDTVRKMMEPQLNKRQATMLNKAVYSDGAHEMLVPEFPKGTKLNFGLGAGVITLEDIPGKRKAGSVSWCGMANSRWWIDPAVGIGAVLMTAVDPLGDPVLNSLYDTLEREVYGGLLPSLRRR